MGENHQDKTESNLTATEDITTWVPNKRGNLWIPKRTGIEGKTRWDWRELIVKALGAFTILVTIIALIFSVRQFNAQQISARQNLNDQQQQTTLETGLDRFSRCGFIRMGF